MRSWMYRPAQVSSTFSVGFAWHKGKIAACAHHAGVTTRSFHRHMRKHNLFKEDFKQKL